MAKKASKRVQVENPLLDAAPALEPQARPVDTFVRPAAPLPYQQTLGFQLASALGVGAGMVDTYAEWVTDEEKERARKAFETSAYKPFDDAVEAGTIEPGQSPAFRREWEKLHTRQRVYDLNDAVRSALAEDEQWANEEDAEQRGLLYHAKRREIMEQMGLTTLAPDMFADVAAPMLDAEEASFRQQDTARRAAEAEDNVIAGIGAEIGTFITDATTAGTPVDPRKLAEQVMFTTQPFAKGQRFKRRINEQVVESLMQAYKDTGNYAYIASLSHIQTGPGSTLGKTPWVKEKVASALDYVEREQRDDLRWKWYKEDRARAEATDGVLAQMLADFEEFGPDSQQVTDSIVALRDLDPRLSQAMDNWRYTLFTRGRSIVEDERYAAWMRKGIIDGEVDTMDIAQAADDGLVDGEAMLSFWLQVNGKDSGFKKAFNMPSITDAATDVRSALNSLYTKNGFPVGSDVDMVTREAARDFRMDAAVLYEELRRENEGRAPEALQWQKALEGLIQQYTRGHKSHRYAPSGPFGTPLPEVAESQVSPQSPRERGEAADAEAQRAQAAEAFRSAEGQPAIEAATTTYPDPPEGAVALLQARKGEPATELAFAQKYGTEALEKHRWPRPSADDIAALQSAPTPEVMAQFDEIFGPGEAQRHLDLADAAVQTQVMP